MPYTASAPRRQARFKQVRLHGRFVVAQMKDDLIFPGYEQDSWVDIQNYREASWPQLVDLWTAYNLHLAHVMSSAPDEKLSQRRSQHTLQTIAFETIKETEPTTLEYLMKDFLCTVKILIIHKGSKLLVIN